MNVLVTGHLGYIGAVVFPLLQSRGHNAIGIDTGFFSQALGNPAGAGFIKEYRLDVREIEASHLEGIDAVIHLAGLSNDSMGQLDPELTDAVNHHASVRLARIAREAGVSRFVFASSCSVYGAADNSHPLGETAPSNPLTAYSRSKVNAEAEIADLANKDFAPTFLRCATAYGLSPSMRFDLVVNNFIGWGLTTGSIRLESDGRAWRPLVHVEDIAGAYIAILEAPQNEIYNQIFNIGRDDQNFRVCDIAAIVRRVIPSCSVEQKPGSLSDRRSYRVSFAKAAQNLPAFRPAWTLEAGVQQVMHFYQQQGLTFEHFQGDSHIRLARLRDLLEAGRLDAQFYWTSKKFVK